MKFLLNGSVGRFDEIRCSDTSWNCELIATGKKYIFHSIDAWMASAVIASNSKKNVINKYSQPFFRAQFITSMIYHCYLEKERERGKEQITNLSQNLSQYCEIGHLHRSKCVWRMYYCIAIVASKGTQFSIQQKHTDQNRRMKIVNKKMCVIWYHSAAAEAAFSHFIHSINAMKATWKYQIKVLHE